MTCKGVGVTEEDVKDRVKWRQTIHCGDAEREQLKEETTFVLI